jgi:stearoyl-CoA desaturase (delta-9 desaturase)
MFYWALQRIFGTCTMIVYVVLFLYLDWAEVQSQATRPITWILFFFQGFRHGALGMTLGFHRYYSHAAFKCKRWFEFLIAYSCAAANQGGMGWWAANHRHHHSNCDTEEDPHSPVTRSIPYAWFGWSYDPKIARRKIQLNYPETRWFDKWCILVPWFEWLLVWYLADSRAFATLVVLTQAWFSPIGTLWFNMASHGGPPDEKGCTARCYNMFTAIILGEADHRDHHDYPGKARRPGPDLPYHLVLLPMAKLGVVWDLRKA